MAATARHAAPAQSMYVAQWIKSFDFSPTQIISQYDNKMEFTKHWKHFFTQAKVSKVLNLDFHFFLYFLCKSKKEFVIMFITRQEEKCVLNKFMHYPTQFIL